MSASLATAVAVAGSALLLACGSTRTTTAASAPTVASVQGSDISRDALAHWLAIKRREPQSSSRPSSASSAQIEQNALAFLITSSWLEKEAAAQGVSVSSSEVQASYQQRLNGPAGRAFAAGLRRRGLSTADELLLMRQAALAQKLRTKVTLGNHITSVTEARQRANAFLAAYRQRWKQRTTCQPGYVIAECANGPPLPRSSGNGP